LTLVYRFARRYRREEWRDRFRQYRLDYQAALYRATPPLLHIANRPPRLEEKPDTAPSALAADSKPAPLHDPHAGSIYTFLADAKIRLQATSGDLKGALETVVTLAESAFVPHYETMNAILKEMLRIHNDMSHTTPATLSASHASLRRSAVPSREYHTSVTPSDIPGLVETVSLPWTQRTLPWLKNRTQRTDNHGISPLLNLLLRHLNQSNIHYSTIRLLSRLATSESLVEMPWEVAERSSQPKTLIRRVQRDLIEAGCRPLLSTLSSRHIRMSRGLLLIMRLEGLGIMPSKDAILLVLTTSVKDGNLQGARALLDRLECYGYTLESNETADLVRNLPSMGLGGLSTAAGEVLSAMYVRSEQLAFLVDLRKYLKDASYLGPYILAIGRCGSATEIWRTWESICDQALKDGVVTTFVEGLVLARDISGAMEFIRVSARQGHALNFWRARAIAKGVQRGQWQVVVDLLREMVVQRANLTQEQLEEILCTIVSRLQKHSDVSISSRASFVADLSCQLREDIESLKDGKDLNTALDAFENILERYQG